MDNKSCTSSWDFSVFAIQGLQILYLYNIGYHVRFTWLERRFYRSGIQTGITLYFMSVDILMAGHSKNYGICNCSIIQTKYGRYNITKPFHNFYIIQFFVSIYQYQCLLPWYEYKIHLMAVILIETVVWCMYIY